MVIRVASQTKISMNGRVPCQLFDGFRRFARKNDAEFALFYQFLWLFDNNSVILPQKLRRYVLYYVA